MNRLLSVGTVALAGAMLVDGASFPRTSAVDGGRTCPVTPTETLLTDVIGPMTGRHPVWAVDGSGGTWTSADTPVKTAWVVSRDRAREVAIVGRRVDGEGVARFRTGSHPPTTMLRLIGAERDLVRPGEASADVMERFAFYPSHILYPTPGCWELSATAGPDTVRIVLALTDRSPARN